VARSAGVVGEGLPSAIRSLSQEPFKFIETPMNADERK
jgi:hypothetical protein